ncbi:hypothetical protein EVY45_17010 [Escherichia coli]|nr:hypothetical protein EVY45_17010 [Escherichia coli]
MSAHYFNPQEMINKTIIFDERPAASVASSFHVAYGIDKNFLFGCGVSITSVLLHNNDVSFVFHVFIDDIPEADIQRLAQLAKSYRTCIQVKDLILLINKVICNYKTEIHGNRPIFGRR